MLQRLKIFSTCILLIGYLSSSHSQQKKTLLWQGYKPDKNSHFILVDDFEKKTLVNISVKATGQESAVVPSVVSKTRLRDEKTTAMAFAEDIKLIRESFQLHKEKDSMGLANAQEFRFFVNQPGHDHFSLLFKNTHFYVGEPRLAAVYLRGNKRKHKVYLLMSVYDSIEQEVFITDLDFSGWQRFEIVIPPRLRKRNPAKSNYFTFQIHGLRIKSYFREEQSLVITAVDQLMVLADLSEMGIPGSEIKDDWK